MSERLQSFLDGVTAAVRCQEVHAEIHEELREHVLSIQAAYIEGGMEPGEALERAIEQMGAPAEIGQRFDRVHRPRIEWVLLGLTLLLTLVGLWVSLSWGVGDLLPRLRLLGIGVAIGAPLIFLDYRRLQRWSWGLYGVTLLVIAYLTSRWFHPDFSQRDALWYLLLVASPHLLAIGQAGIMRNWDWQRRWSLPIAFGLLLAPLLLYGDLISLRVTYLILWSVQLFASRPPKVARIGLGVLLATGSTLVTWHLLQAEYRVHRLLSWLNLSRDPNGVGYHVLQSLGALRGAGLLGHGPFSKAANLPEPTSDFVFPYLVHTLGWVGGVAILLLIAGFGLRLVRAARQIQEPFGASLMRLIGVSLLLSGGWNLLMAVGIVPVMAYPLPFISGDGALVYQLALMGLAVGIYRRKDLQPAPARAFKQPGAPA